MWGNELFGMAKKKRLNLFQRLLRRLNGIFAVSRPKRRAAPKRKPPSKSPKKTRKKTSGVQRDSHRKKNPQEHLSARARKKGPALEKHEENPVIQPSPDNEWETKAVFNPAAIYEGGKVHLAYRAIGERDRSMLGYAASEDGFVFTERLDQPMYIPREPFEGGCEPEKTRGAAPSGAFLSGGGGWGGCEDPRMTRIGDRVYMTYVAYDGWSAPRVALTSILLEEFLAKNWKRWEPPVLISAPHVVNKNACLFPEKVRGKYVILHRVFPNILLDYVDDLDFDGKTKWLKGQYKIKPDPKGWDSRKIGAGAPPIKTKNGWLLIYQAVDDKRDHQYKIGAMLLDLEHPERVIARSKEPVLAPENWYENDGWKSGVVYPCGAIVKDGQLIIYYGGADMYVCIATAPLDAFVQDLIKHRIPTLTPAKKSSNRKRYAAR